MDYGCVPIPDIADIGPLMYPPDDLKQEKSESLPKLPGKLRMALQKHLKTNETSKELEITTEISTKTATLIKTIRPVIETWTESPIQTVTHTSFQTMENVSTDTERMSETSTETSPPSDHQAEASPERPKEPVTKKMHFPLSLELMKQSFMARIMEKLPNCFLEPEFPTNLPNAEIPYIIPNKTTMDSYLKAGGVAFSHPPIIEINTKTQMYLTYADGKPKFPFTKDDMVIMDLPETWPLNFYCPICNARDHCLIIDNTYACPQITKSFLEILNRPLQPFSPNFSLEE